MNRTALYIDGIEVPTLQDVPAVLTFTIADVRDPSARNASYSKTIEIPSTPEIDKIFEFIFEVNISLNNFNPNIKKSARITFEGIEQFSGNIQLRKIRVNKITGLIIYECNMIGYYADLFYSIGGSLLTDLDFSEYDHVLNSTNINNTWDPSIIPNTNKISGSDVAVVSGIGYRYPLIDYGLNNGNVQNYYAQQLRPGLFAYEYLSKIFLNSGKTFNSTFLTGSFFKTLMIPCTEVVKVSDTNKANRQCVVGSYVVLTYYKNNLLTYNGLTLEWDAPNSQDVPAFPDEGPPSFSDPGNIHSTVTGEITVPASGKYYVLVNIVVLTNINPPIGSYVDHFFGGCGVDLQMDSGSGWTAVASADPIPGQIFSGNGFGFQFNCSFSGAFNAGTKFRILTSVDLTHVEIRDILTHTIVSAGVATYDIGFTNNVVGFDNNNFSLTLVDDNIFYGDTLELKDSIPKNIKQSDFVNSIIKMFNLYIELDKDNPNNYFIEPRNDFYTGSYVDWTKKFDASFDLEISPMGELDSKNYIHQYKSDSDYYNQSYQDAYNVSYGYHNFEVENEFVKGENTTELIFSPTPIVGNLLNGLIIPKIYKNDGTSTTHIKSNIRILQWAGSINISSGQWIMRNPSGIVKIFSAFPYAGHIDNPYSPTIDLSFGAPYEFYYNLFPTFIYTTNTLFEIYHSIYINTISNKNSKIVSGRFNLNELDIKNIDFRSLVYFDNSFYYLNAINEYDVNNPGTTLVELLKLN